MIARGARGSGELRQHLGPRLRAGLARRKAVGIRLADDRVVVHRVLEHTGQILRCGDARECEQHQGNNRGANHDTPFFERSAASGGQKVNRGGRAALTSGSITVSNRLSVAQASSAVRRTRRASITGASPTTTNSRPPKLNMRSKRAS